MKSEHLLSVDMRLDNQSEGKPPPASDVLLYQPATWNTRIFLTVLENIFDWKCLNKERHQSFTLFSTCQSGHQTLTLSFTYLRASHKLQYTIHKRRVGFNQLCSQSSDTICYKAPLRDVVGLKSRGCRKLKRGDRGAPRY